MVTLDSFFQRQKLDLVKIDVEGYEENVLNGAINLLADKHRSPRRIYIEMHPFAWDKLGTTDKSILRLLKSFGYETYTLAGFPVIKIDSWTEVISIKQF
jgi:hypothetical protein